MYAPTVPASGAVDVVLNDASRALTITVDDQLVVQRAHARRAHIVGIPPGPVHVHVATGGQCEVGSIFDRDVIVAPGARATLALPGPETNVGCAVFDGLYYIGLNIGILAIAVLAASETHVVHARW
jgi:hypothetical protein